MKKVYLFAVQKESRIFILFLRNENAEKEEEPAHEEKPGNTIFYFTCSCYISLLVCPCWHMTQCIHVI